MIRAQDIPLGTVVCQRRFNLYTEDGQPHMVVVQLGMPVATTMDGGLLVEGEKETGTFRCPFQITGLGHDERVDASFGGDPFIALQYAIDLIGKRLDMYSKTLNMINRRINPDPMWSEPPSFSWIWTYPDEQMLLH